MKERRERASWRKIGKTRIIVQRRISLAELLRAEVSLRPEEALAVAQQLIDRNFRSNPAARGPQSDDFPQVDASAPGPPTPANVFLNGDGVVSCPACDATLAVSEVAIFLQSILPSSASHVVGSLRYLVARALLDVDAPPFDSLEDFSRALARHERGDRTEVVRRLLDRARADIIARSGEAALVDRRRTVPGIAELRRELRERDARVYDQQLALNALQGMVGGGQSTPWRPLTLVAGLVIGVTMVGAGEALYIWHRAPMPLPDQPRSIPAVGLEPAPPVIGPSLSPSREPFLPPSFVKIATTDSIATSRRRASVRTTASAKAGSSRKSVKRSLSQSMGPSETHPVAESQRKRAPFGWLRSKIVFRDDPL